MRMPLIQPRRLTIVALLLLALLALAACGPRAGGGQAAAAAGAGDSVVDLPAIYVNFDDSGQATVGGMRLSQAGALIGQSLPDIDLDADIVAALQEYNIQHIQLVNSEKGLDILVNGLRVPSLGWNAEVLGNMRMLLDSLGVDLGSAGALLPMLGNFNTGVVLNFPRAPGQAALPLVDPDTQAIADRARQAAQAFASGGGDIPVVHFTVNYQPDGTWLVDDKDAAAWEESLPLGLWDGFNLSPEVLAGAEAVGIRTLTLSTNEEGINLSLNGKLLPTVTWGNGEMANVLHLLDTTGIMDLLTGGNPQVAGILDLAEGLLPTIQAADFSMTVDFPAP